MRLQSSFLPSPLLAIKSLQADTEKNNVIVNPVNYSSSETQKVELVNHDGLHNIQISLPINTGSAILDGLLLAALLAIIGFAGKVLLVYVKSSINAAIEYSISENLKTLMDTLEMQQQITRSLLEGYKLSSDEAIKDLNAAYNLLDERTQITIKSLLDNLGKLDATLERQFQVLAEERNARNKLEETVQSLLLGYQVYQNRLLQVESIYGELQLTVRQLDRRNNYSSSSSSSSSASESTFLRRKTDSAPTSYIDAREIVEKEIQDLVKLSLEKITSKLTALQVDNSPAPELPDDKALSRE